ncbi:hypothetical protein D3C79_656390 [compost metagenome]
MPIGTFAGIEHVRRVGNDKVEQPGNAAEQVTWLHGHIAQARQCRVDRGVTQRERVDVHGADLGMWQRLSNQQGPDTRAATNVHGMLDALRGALQMIMDDLGETVTVRAEKHRVGFLGGVRGVHQQQVRKCGPAHGADQQLPVFPQHLGTPQLIQFIGRHQRRTKRSAPAKHIAHCPGPLSPWACVHASMGRRCDTGEAVAVGEQAPAQLQHCLVSLDLLRIEQHQRVTSWIRPVARK